MSRGSPCNLQRSRHRRQLRNPLPRGGWTHRSLEPISRGRGGKTYRGDFPIVAEGETYRRFTHSSPNSREKSQFHLPPALNFGGKKFSWCPRSSITRSHRVFQSGTCRDLSSIAFGTIIECVVDTYHACFLHACRNHLITLSTSGGSPVLNEWHAAFFERGSLFGVSPGV
jgi:hypothetical protein